MIFPQEPEWRAIQCLIQPNELHYAFAFHNAKIALLICLDGTGGLQPLRPYHNLRR